MAQLCSRGPVWWGGELLVLKELQGGPGLLPLSQVGKQRPGDGEELAQGLTVTERAGEGGQGLLGPDLPTQLRFTLRWG